MTEDRFRVIPGKKFRLEDHDTGDTGRLRIQGGRQAPLREGAGEAARAAGEALRPGPLGAAAHLPGHGRGGQGRHDRARHVRREPAGCQVFSFKAPSPEELDHDFLWRTTRCLPERGRIGIFNRSYYEEVLVVRVHPEILAEQKLPTALVTDRIWKERYEDIKRFERYLPATAP